jgi:hypothetical protein
MSTQGISNALTWQEALALAPETSGMRYISHGYYTEIGRSTTSDAQWVRLLNCDSHRYSQATLEYPRTDEEVEDVLHLRGIPLTGWVPGMAPFPPETEKRTGCWQQALEGSRKQSVLVCEDGQIASPLASNGTWTIFAETDGTYELMGYSGKPRFPHLTEAALSAQLGELGIDPSTGWELTTKEENTCVPLLWQKECAKYWGTL